MLGMCNIQAGYCLQKTYEQIILSFASHGSSCFTCCLPRAGRDCSFTLLLWGVYSLSVSHYILPPPLLNSVEKERHLHRTFLSRLKIVFMISYFHSRSSLRASSCTPIKFLLPLLPLLFPKLSAFSWCPALSNGSLFTDAFLPPVHGETQLTSSWPHMYSNLFSFLHPRLIPLSESWIDFNLWAQGPPVLESLVMLVKKCTTCFYLSKIWRSAPGLRI